MRESFEKKDSMDLRILGDSSTKLVCQVTIMFR